MSAEHEELESSVAAYVLGSLDTQERDRMRIHLEGCATCRELTARLEPGVSALALEPEPFKPPSRLEDRLIAAATAVGGTAAPPPQRARRFVLSGSPRVRFPSPGLRAGLAAAAVVLLAVGAATGVGLDRAGVLRQGAQPSTPEVKRYQLQGSGSMAGVQARAVSIERDSVTLVDFKDMPAPERGRVYQLWLITSDGKAESAGVFAPESDGSKVVLVDRDLHGIKALAVTSEPGPNGSQTPSQAPQIEGRIT
jgi:anti-sigma-K factor RskA